MHCISCSALRLRFLSFKPLILISLIVLFAVSLCCSTVLMAQPRASLGSGNWPHSEREGELIAFQIVPFGKEFKILLVGEPAVKLKFDDVKLEISYGLGKDKKSLQVQKRIGPDGSYFVVQPGPAQKLDLRFQVDGLNKEESFQVDVPKSP